MTLIKTSHDIRVESLYKRVTKFAKKASRDVTVDILKLLKNKDDILPALYGMMDVLEVHIIDAMVAAHLMGYLRSLIIAANHMSEQKLFGQYDDAINFAKKRLEIPKSQLNALKKSYGSYAINATQGMSTAVEKKVQRAMKTIIERNYHIKNAMMYMNSTLKKAGVNSMNPWLIETTVRTQIHTAYSAGRWDANQDPAIQTILWGYQYITAGDFRVRDEHEMLDGIRLPKEDPQWSRIWPPNGFNCRCEVIEIFKDDKKRAIRKEIPAAKTVGNRLIIPGADEGWAINHGEVFISGISRSPVVQDVVQEFMTIVDKFGRQIHVPLKSKFSAINTEKNKLKWIKSFEQHKDDKLKWMRAVDDLIAKGEKVNFETSFWHPRAIHYYNWQSARVAGRAPRLIPIKSITVKPKLTVPKKSDTLKQAINKSSNKDKVDDLFTDWQAGGEEAQFIREGELVIKNGLAKELEKFSDDAKEWGRKYLLRAKEKAELFNKTLDSVKPYKGTIYRGSSYEDYQSLGKLKEGMIYTQEGSSSGTSSFNIAKDFIEEVHGRKYKDLYLLEIKSKTGIQIGSYADDFAYQKEIIIRRNTTYKVIKVVDKYDDELETMVKHITLEEIPVSKKIVTETLIEKTKFKTAEEYRQNLIASVEKAKLKYKESPEWIKLKAESESLKREAVTARDKYTDLYKTRNLPGVSSKRNLLDEQMGEAWRKQSQVVKKMLKIKKSIEVDKRTMRKLLSESKSMKGEIKLWEAKKFQKTTDEILDWIPKDKIGAHEARHIHNLNFHDQVGADYFSNALGEYSKANSAITMYTNSQSTFAHELGHHLAYKTRGFMGNQTAFHRARTAGEISKKLPGYRDIFGKKDKYGSYDYYAGRRYNDGSFPEIASVGIEHIWMNPYTAATKDPEWFNMIMSSLKKIPVK